MDKRKKTFREREKERGWIKWWWPMLRNYKKIKLCAWTSNYRPDDDHCVTLGEIFFFLEGSEHTEQFAIWIG